MITVYRPLFRSIFDFVFEASNQTQQKRKKKKSGINDIKMEFNILTAVY